MNPLVVGAAGLTFAYIEYGKMPEKVFWLLIFTSTLLVVVNIFESKKE